MKHGEGSYINISDYMFVFAGSVVPPAYRHSFHSTPTGALHPALPDPEWSRPPGEVRLRAREGRELPRIVQYPGSGPGVEVLPRTRRNHGCDRRPQEGGRTQEGGRKLPQIPQYPPHDPSMRDSIHIAYENENPQPEYRQRSLPRTPRERQELGLGPGGEQGVGRVHPSPRCSPKRISDSQQYYDRSETDLEVPDRKQSHKAHRSQDDPYRRRGDGARAVRGDQRKPNRHSRPEEGRRRPRSELGPRTRSGRSRMMRQSPVEERLSVHEDDSMSDAFDDDGLFQIDENFAKFLDDKTSCQK